MAKVTKADRIAFAHFFSVDPVDALMVAEHKKEKFEDGDIVAELFTPKFGRELELGFLGGFQNGFDLKVNQIVELTPEQIASIDEKKFGEEYQLLAKRPGIAVLMMTKTINGETARAYLFFTCHGALSCIIGLDEISKAEADYYHKMFASAQAVGLSESGNSADDKKPEAPKPSAEDIANEKLREAREKETKRVEEQIGTLKWKIASLENDAPNRRSAAQAAERKYSESANKLKDRIAEAEAPCNRGIKAGEEKIAVLKKQKDSCEQQIQQTRAAHSKTFFLAFGKKKALQAQIDELNRQLSGYHQQISDQQKKIDEDNRKKAKAVEGVRQAHESLKKAMEQAKQNQAQLSDELASAKSELQSAQERLAQIPNMSLEQLTPKKPERTLTPTQRENEMLKERICDVLAGSYGMTVSDIMDSDPELQMYSAQRISAVLRQMTLEGTVERSENMRKVYFSLA